MKYLILLLTWSFVVDAADLSFGYVPTSFPRDPVEIHQFDEHVVLGQILEAIVDADGDGKLVPSIAKEWHFGSDGLKVYFHLDPEVKFSNGNLVKVEDVIYSVERHMTSNSQSKFFLNDIKDLKSEKPNQITITLKRKNSSILKALSRDQLGIVPNGWTFKSDSSSPFIGTGPYNLIRKNNNWFLEKNPHHKRHAVPIKTWKLVFYKDSKMSMPDEIPTVIPVMTLAALEGLKKNANYSESTHQVLPRLGFTQTSFWAHPRGKIFGDKIKRLQIQAMLNDVIGNFCSASNLNRATGLIPKGIQGSLADLPLIKSPIKIEGINSIKIASLAGNFAKLFSPENIELMNTKYGIKADVKFFSFVEKAAIQEFEPDIVMGSWAGGFNDPAGFLALIAPLIGQDFRTYLGKNLGEKLETAETEQDFAKRATDFRSFGTAIIAEGLLTPGWRVNTFELSSKKVANKLYQTRYTPRLISYAEVD